MRQRVLKYGLLLFVLYLIASSVNVADLRPPRVSGPSMAPTWLGPHRTVTCGDCGWQFAVAESLKYEDGRATCPLCGNTANDWRESSLRRGERLVIEAFNSDGSRPQRWDAVVFECPPEVEGAIAESARPVPRCLKRVVGLPGETISIRGGEVYVNGEMARKPLAVARSFGFIVDDTRFRPKRQEEFLQGWHAVVPSSPDSGDSPIKWLEYRHGADGSAAVVDNYGVNQTVSRQLNRVDDLVATVRLPITRPPTSIWLRTLCRGIDYHIRLDLSNQNAELRHGSDIAAVADLSIDVTSADAIEIEWGSLDGDVLLAIDEYVVLRLPVAQEVPTDLSAEQKENRQEDLNAAPLFAIGSKQERLSIDFAQVWRDVYYTPVPVGHSPALTAESTAVPPGHDFVMGDNSPVSLDSRVPGSGLVPHDSQLGRLPAPSREER